jgi:hypothetical protein
MKEITKIDILISNSEIAEIYFPEWRKGQALFNTLHKYYPNIADSIRGGQYDTFYNNDRIEDCINYLKTKI